MLLYYTSAYIYSTKWDGASAGDVVIWSRFDSLKKFHRTVAKPAMIFGLDTRGRFGRCRNENAQI